MRVLPRGLWRRLAAVLIGVAACTPSAGTASSDRGTATKTSASSAASASVPTSIASSQPAAIEPSDAVYPWSPTSTPSDRLDQRFQVPQGFTRVAVGKTTFGAFLRTLPLKVEGSPVVDYRGNKLHDDGRHPNIVAVADLDVGTKDLQHCADVIVRLHAEWRYGRGDRDLSYRAVSGQTLSYRRYMNGDRSIVSGKDLLIQHAAAARKDDHPLLREWLDDVFSWAGTASIERDGKKVPSAAVQAGDFFVMSGSPFGHAVLILDVAKDDKGRIAFLLGQSYMPAQSFQILRPHAEGGPWFIVEPNDAAVATPFWKPFPLTSLRRL